MREVANLLTDLDRAVVVGVEHDQRRLCSTAGGLEYSLERVAHDKPLAMLYPRVSRQLDRERLFGDEPAKEHRYCSDLTDAFDDHEGLQSASPSNSVSRSGSVTADERSGSS